MALDNTTDFKAIHSHVRQRVALRPPRLHAGAAEEDAASGKLDRLPLMKAKRRRTRTITRLGGDRTFCHIPNQ